jgi:hypothetical protein
MSQNSRSQEVRKWETGMLVTVYSIFIPMEISDPRGARKYLGSCPIRFSYPWKFRSQRYEMETDAGASN